MVFVSAKGKELLKQVNNDTVLTLGQQHRQAGLQFIAYVSLVLFGSIMYFSAF